MKNVDGTPVSHDGTNMHGKRVNALQLVGLHCRGE